MINRSSITLKYREPAVKWINEADPYDDDPGITLKSVNEDRTVYLIREEDADTPDNLKEWIELNYEVLFEHELDGWYTDENLWPKKRTLNLFYKWFDAECNTVIIDTVDSDIIDE